MSMSIEYALQAAWQRVDDRLAALQHRHREQGGIPLYEADLNPPATDHDLQQLESILGFPVPFELAYSLKRWNGRSIAPDHGILLNPVAFVISAAERSAMRDNDVGWMFEEVIGPVNPLLESKRRIFFGEHDWSGSSLFLDYETPPAGGMLGQVIRVGEDPVAKFVSASFVDFLNLVAAAPAFKDDVDFDPLEWPR